MINFNQIFPKNLYHSYVIEDKPEEIVYLLRAYLEEEGHINKQSPDALLNLYESFSIQDSQKIKEWYYNMPTDGKKKICIIGAKFINREAEQTLLKIIEEPTPNTHFFIVVPDASLLLGTILSRVHLIKNLEKNNDFDDKIANNFIKSSPDARIEIVANIIKEFKDYDNSGSLRFRAVSLINGLERILYKKWKDDVNNENNRFIMNELASSRSYLSIPGASVKMILEHIALVL
jgi:hypothetical protein